jgi:hypothetical protein
VEGLFFRASRPLPPPLGPVDDEARVPSGNGWALGEVAGTPLGTNAELVQGLLEDRQKPMNPMVDLGLTQAREFAHDGLKGIGLEIDPDKQELIFGPMQGPLAAPARRTSAGLTLGGLAGRIDSLRGKWKGRQQTLKLRERQASEGQEPPPVRLEWFVSDHAPIISLIPDNVYFSK